MPTVKIDMSQLKQVDVTTEYDEIGKTETIKIISKGMVVAIELGASNKIRKMKISKKK